MHNYLYDWIWKISTLYHPITHVHSVTCPLNESCPLGDPCPLSSDQCSLDDLCPLDDPPIWWPMSTQWPVSTWWSTYFVTLVHSVTHPLSDLFWVQFKKRQTSPDSCVIGFLWMSLWLVAKFAADIITWEQDMPRENPLCHVPFETGLASPTGWQCTQLVNLDQTNCHISCMNICIFCLWTHSRATAWWLRCVIHPVMTLRFEMSPQFSGDNAENSPDHREWPIG